MNPFKGRHFQRGDIILLGRTLVLQIRHQLPWLQEMLAERGVNVDHSTIYRWVQRYAPEMEKRLRWYWRNPSDLCLARGMDGYIEGQWPLGVSVPVRRRPGPALSILSLLRRNSKAAYRFR